MKRQFLRLVVSLSLLMAILALSSHVLYAGDQEGVSGYKFKIYDADGDGIDGNEGGSGQGGGLLQSSTPLHQSKSDDREEIFFVWMTRLLLMGWLK